MIKINHLTLKYSARKVIDDFSCEISAGSITAIVGRNGVGKSTLLQAIAGDVEISEGTIEINQCNVEAITLLELASIRSLAKQHSSYWMAYSVREILLLGNENVALDRFERIVSALEIEIYLDQTVTTLSGGELQRIEIARALIRGLPLVLLDEPFASQDVDSIERIKTLLLREKSEGNTIILVAHARLEELLWCDQVLSIEAK